MFDLHAFGLAGGARGVDDIAKVLRRCAGFRAAQAVGGLGGNLGLQLVQRENFAMRSGSTADRPAAASSLVVTNARAWQSERMKRTRSAGYSGSSGT